ncbi:hypothetical protein EDB83DRAFT_2535331 [Lactarius deliciosus]|nr:hypothetical protein EDB83DRAFT_2535331 [Lactarius deliciosus]
MSSITPTSPSLPAPWLALEFTDDVPELLSSPPTPLSASLARSEVPTSLSPPMKPLPSKSPTSVPAHSLPPLRPSPGESCCNRVLEPFATPASSYPPESPLSSLDEPIPFLPAPVEPTPHSSMTSQRSLRVTSIGSDCSALEVTPALTLPVTRFVSQSRQPPLVYKFLVNAHARSPTHFAITAAVSFQHRLLQLRVCSRLYVSPHFDFFLTFRRPLSPSQASSARSHRRQPKQLERHLESQDRQRLRATIPAREAHSPAPHASFSTQGARLQVQLSHQISAPEDARKPKSKTCSIFIALHNAPSLPIPVPSTDSSFSTLEANPQVQVSYYLRHVKTFASARLPSRDPGCRTSARP